MKPYYECHITIKGDPKAVEPLVKPTGWKFSSIDGDPVLGKGVLCYATAHFNAGRDTADVVIAMGIVADELANLGADVIRQKVELVVFDTKAGSTAAREAA